MGMPFENPLETLETPRLRLRPFAATDAARVQELLAVKDIADGTLTIPYPYPEGAAEQWIATHGPKWAEGKLAIWAMADRDSDDVAGAISLRLVMAHRRAEAGYWVARDRWGQGLATEALRAVLAYGFGTLELHRIEAHHFTQNPGSGRVMQKVGMRHEGRVRGAVFRHGVPRDLELYGILREDPRS